MVSKATTPIVFSLLLSLGLTVGQVQADDQDQGWIAYNTDLLKQRLRNPDSAEFRNVFLSRKASVPVACGEVNATTESGVMSGFQRFVGAGSVGVFLPWDVDDFDTLWGHFCR